MTYEWCNLGDRVGGYLWYMNISIVEKILKWLVEHGGETISSILGTCILFIVGHVFKETNTSC